MHYADGCGGPRAKPQAQQSLQLQAVRQGRMLVVLQPPTRCQRRMLQAMGQRQGRRRRRWLRTRRPLQRRERKRKSRWRCVVVAMPTSRRGRVADGTVCGAASFSVPIASSRFVQMDLNAGCLRDAARDGPADALRSARAACRPTTEKGSLHEYSGEHDAKSLKTFRQEHLPRFSKRVDIGQFSFPLNVLPNLPQVLLLSTKKDTPVMWRVVSGIFRNRLIFYDAEVRDVALPLLKSLGVKNLIAQTVNGDRVLLKDGISVKDLRSGIRELKTLLDCFEMKNKKLETNQSKKPFQTSQQKENKVPLLIASNFEEICGDKSSVCVIGVFGSNKAKGQLEAVLSEISKKTLIRGQNYNSGNPVSYALLDGNKQSSFLSSFDKSGLKSSDKLLIAYKPRRGRFAIYKDEVTLEGAEIFVGSVLNGNVQLSGIKQKPVLK